MKYAEFRIVSDCAYLLPIGDLHIGDRNFDEPRLCETIEWVRNCENARVVLTGDILNCATRTSASSQAYEIKNLQDQITTAVSLFAPIKEKILGAIDGNHEQRLQDLCGYSPLTAVCVQLGIPYYAASVVIALSVGTGKVARRQVKGYVKYLSYFHHTVGGGSTVGAKLNRVDRLRRLICNADIYVGGHNHQLGVIPVETRFVDGSHKRIMKIRQLLIDGGSYLKWDDGYAEMKQLEPSKLGSPRIRLDGQYRDVHASV